MEEDDELLKEYRARAEEMVAFREEGLTLLEIGQRYGMSVQGVREILSKTEKDMKLTLRIDYDTRQWLGYMVEFYGFNTEYWLMKAAKAGRYDVEERALKGKLPVSIVGEP